MQVSVIIVKSVLGVNHRVSCWLDAPAGAGYPRRDAAICGVGVVRPRFRGAIASRLAPMMASRIATSVVAVVVALVALEIMLRACCSFAVTPTGDRRAGNAQWYGWGYDPHQTITVRDPDSERVYADRANGAGWRDLERPVENTARRFRILALGDSTTFGMVVPAERTWTRVLEERLRSEGFDAEVLNMSYPGWGTDQALEALIREGLTLRPDLVIMQFTVNDLTDNAYFVDGDRTLKPFYYTLDGDDGLLRQANPYFGGVGGSTWRDYAHALIARSELLKRVYAAYELYSWRTKPAYTVTDGQLTHLQISLAAGRDDPGIREVSGHLGGAIERIAVVRAAALAAKPLAQPSFLRVLENRPFSALWIPRQYHPPDPDPGSFEWRLLFALLREAHARVREHGVSLALLSEQDLGLYRWERKWFRIGPDAASQRSYLMPTRRIEEFARREGIGFIDNVEIYARARNDSHPNARGYEAMARNVHRYLLRDHGRALGTHRLPGESHAGP